jgi:DUF4097 and DUF4098 domain-containing protein YvlB
MSIKHKEERNMPKTMTFLCYALVTANLATTSMARAEHRHDWHKVIGDIEVHENERAGDIQSVNGDIHLEDDSDVESVSTTNGEIRIEDNVKAVSLNTVNGSIRAGRGLQVDRNVQTVNGEIFLRANSQIGESVMTLNGEIRMVSTTVGRDIEITNGDVSLENSVVEGDIVFNDIRHGRNRHSEPTLRIDAASTVKGKIILRQEVRLVIEDGATIGEIVRDLRS